MKIKKGDLVQVITGKDKGKQGKVTPGRPTLLAPAGLPFRCERRSI